MLYKTFCCCCCAITMCLHYYFLVLIILFQPVLKSFKLFRRVMGNLCSYLSKRNVVERDDVEGNISSKKHKKHIGDHKHNKNFVKQSSINLRLQSQDKHRNSQGGEESSNSNAPLSLQHFNGRRDSASVIQEKKKNSTPHNVLKSNKFSLQYFTDNSNRSGSGKSYQTSAPPKKHMEHKDNNRDVQQRGIKLIKSTSPERNYNKNLNINNSRKLIQPSKFSQYEVSVNVKPPIDNKHRLNNPQVNSQISKPTVTNDSLPLPIPIPLKVIEDNQYNSQNRQPSSNYKEVTVGPIKPARTFKARPVLETSFDYEVNHNSQTTPQPSKGPDSQLLKREHIPPLNLNDKNYSLGDYSRRLVDQLPKENYIPRIIESSEIVSEGKDDDSILVIRQNLGDIQKVKLPSTSSKPIRSSPTALNNLKQFREVDLYNVTRTKVQGIAGIPQEIVKNKDDSNISIIKSTNQINGVTQGFCEPLEPSTPTKSHRDFMKARDVNTEGFKESRHLEENVQYITNTKVENNISSVTQGFCEPLETSTPPKSHRNFMKARDVNTEGFKESRHLEENVHYITNTTDENKIKSVIQRFCEPLETSTLVKARNLNIEGFKESRHLEEEKDKNTIQFQEPNKLKANPPLDKLISLPEDSLIENAIPSDTVNTLNLYSAPANNKNLFDAQIPNNLNVRPLLPSPSENNDVDCKPNSHFIGDTSLSKAIQNQPGVPESKNHIEQNMVDTFIYINKNFMSRKPFTTNRSSEETNNSLNNQSIKGEIYNDACISQSNANNHRDVKSLPYEFPNKDPIGENTNPVILSNNSNLNDIPLDTSIHSTIETEKTKTSFLKRQFLAELVDNGIKTEVQTNENNLKNTAECEITSSVLPADYSEEYCVKESYTTNNDINNANDETKMNESKIEPHLLPGNSLDKFKKPNQTLPSVLVNAQNDEINSSETSEYLHLSEIKSIIENAETENSVSKNLANFLFDTNTNISENSKITKTKKTIVIIKQEDKVELIANDTELPEQENKMKMSIICEEKHNLVLDEATKKDICKGGFGEDQSKSNNTNHTNSSNLKSPKILLSLGLTGKKYEQAQDSPFNINKDTDHFYPQKSFGKNQNIAADYLRKPENVETGVIVLPFNKSEGIKEKGDVKRKGNENIDSKDHNSYDSNTYTEATEHKESMTLQTGNLEEEKRNDQNVINKTSGHDTNTPFKSNLNMDNDNENHPSDVPKKKLKLGPTVANTVDIEYIVTQDTDLIDNKYFQDSKDVKLFLGNEETLKMRDQNRLSINIDENRPLHEDQPGTNESIVYHIDKNDYPSVDDSDMKHLKGMTKNKDISRDLSVGKIDEYSVNLSINQPPESQHQQIGPSVPAVEPQHLEDEYVDPQVLKRVKVFLKQITEKAKPFEDEIEVFTELEDSNKYYYIEESLRRLIDKLDDMFDDIGENTVLRKERKKVYRYIFPLFDRLDDKVAENKDRIDREHSKHNRR